MTERKAFKICHNKGFHLRFENGLTVSVQFGAGNYCDNRDNMLKKPIDALCRIPQESNTAEVAVFNDKGKWFTKKFFKRLGDDVKGWCNVEEVADLIYKVKNYKT